MKHNFIKRGLFVAVVASSLLAGCQKEEGPVSGVPESPTAGGLFQVDASGTKVKFAPGNLRYTTNATNHWSFCENQYDYESSNNGSNGVWDYFGWSTNGASFQYGMSQSKTVTDYSGNFKDWGTAVNRQGNLGTGWRTLTKDEWDYIFNSRPGATIGATSDCRYLKATVCDNPGVILIPDGCTWPSGVTYVAAANFNAADLPYGKLHYNATVWASLEAAGCVFLPAANERMGATIYEIDRGYYWSSTLYNEKRPFSLYFSGTVVNTQMHDFRCYGLSVRLVQDQD